MSTLGQIGQMARRSILQTVRQPAMVIPPIVFPLLLVSINSAGLQAATKIPGFPSDSYWDFAIAVPFIQGSLFAAINAGSSLARDVETGFIKRLAMTPMKRTALLAGQLIGSMVVAFVSACVYLLAGFVAGMDFKSGALGVPTIIVLGVLIALGFAALGAYIGLRSGSGEAVQGFFPLLFVLLFLSSVNLPAEPDRAGLVPHDRHLQPGLLPGRGRALADHHRLGRRGAGPRVRARRRDRRGHDHALGRRPANEVDPHMSRFLGVTQAVAWRTIHNFATNPAYFFPSLIFPLFFFTAFAGGLSSVGNVPGFDFPAGYTAFQFVFVLLQASAFGGVFTGFGIAADFEKGFARRLLLGAPNRLGILAGYAVAALTRAAVVGVLLFLVALATGMRVTGGGVDLFGLIVLAALVNLTATFFAAGVAFRTRTIQAGPAMQMPVFIVLFLAPVFVPLALVGGWVHTVAKYNPVTALLEGGRDLISGQSFSAALAFGIAVALPLVFSVWAVRGLRRAEASG